MKPSNFVLNTDFTYPGIRRHGVVPFNKTGNTPSTFTLIDDASNNYDYLVWEDSGGDISVVGMNNPQYNGTIKMFINNGSLQVFMGDNANRSGNLVWREYGL